MTPPLPRLLGDGSLELSAPQVVVAPGEAVALHVVRPAAWAIRSTRYLLQTVDGRLLLLTRHWLEGAQALRWAQEVAGALGVPLVDVEGERRRRSTWRCVRWLGSGEDYKLILPTWGLATAVGALVWRCLSDA